MLCTYRVNIYLGISSSASNKFTFPFIFFADTKYDAKLNKHDSNIFYVVSPFAVNIFTVLPQATGCVLSRSLNAGEYRHKRITMFDKQTYAVNVFDE